MRLHGIYILTVLLLFIIYEHVDATSALQKALTPVEYTTNTTNDLRTEFRMLKCKTDKDCHEHGWCKDGTCECEKGWITWHTSRRCSYKQSSKIMAFVVSFVMGIVGVDWFMLSRKDSLYILCGILKLLLAAGCCIWNPLAARSKSRHATTAASCLSVSLTLMSFIWWFVDWIRILLNSFPDGNGAPLM